MDTPRLDGVKVAVLATNGFEQSELVEPKKALEDAGATVHVVSPASGSIKGWDKKDWGDSVDVDVALSDASADDYDGLVLPGGQMNPDVLRIDADAVAFVRAFADAAKPIAAICHAPWLLIEAGIAADRDVTSWPSVKTDLTNAGARWTDREVVRCGSGAGPLVTSRKPEDIPAFNETVIEVLAETRVAA